jgi:hypothetical protein
MTTVRDAIDRLQEALTELERALEAGDASRVLASEGPLADAIRALDSGVPRGESAPERLALRARVDGLRALLSRCRALGASSAALADAMFPQIVYGRAGATGRRQA